MRTFYRFLSLGVLVLMSFVATRAMAQRPMPPKSMAQQPKLQRPKSQTATTSVVENKAFYAFGVVYSMTDSMAYITEVQPITVSTLNSGEVAMQEVLSERLKLYVMQTYGVTQPVSAIFVEEKSEKANKLMAKVRKPYIKKGGEHKWTPIPVEKFRFLTLDTPQN